MQQQAITASGEDRKNALTRLKLFAYVTLANYAFSAVYSLVSNQQTTFWFMLIAAASVLVALIVGIKLSVSAGQIMVVTLLNANIFLFCQNAGLMGISYIFFFPVLIASVILVGFDKLNWQIVYVIICTTACLALTMNYSGEMPVTSLPIETIRSNRTANVWIVYSLMVLFILLLVRLKFRSDKKLLAALQQAEEAAQAKTKFLSVMSHELRTPLNGIIGISHLLQSSDAEPKKAEYLQLLNKSADHMLRMIGDILDYNKMDSNRLELQQQPVNLQQLFDDLCMQFAPQCQQRALYFKKEQPTNNTNLQVVGDDIRIAQVLYNLLGNALKFTRNGGITFSMQTKQLGNELQIDFAVTDTGVGIEAADQELIFEDFQQGAVTVRHKLGGTGLGLAISKRILQQMGSQLHVESKVGKGSRFSFTLLLPIAKEEAVITNAVQQKFDNSDLKVLLVEDNQINTVVATNMLKKWNIAVDTANNGEDAIYLLENDSYSLVLMDLEMPVMDGFTATAILRSRNNDIPIIALTAALMEKQTLKKLEDLGFNDVVSKPFKPDALYGALQKFLC
jgi:signal transduction histidine kinase